MAGIEDQLRFPEDRELLEVMREAIANHQKLLFEVFEDSQRIKRMIESGQSEGDYKLIAEVLLTVLPKMMELNHAGFIALQAAYIHMGGTPIP